MESGFNAMGKPVPANRLQKGYTLVKQLLNCDTELAWAIANKCKEFIQRDECSFIIGNINGLTVNNVQDKCDNEIALIDVTGRYRLLAEMLTD